MDILLYNKDILLDSKDILLNNKDILIFNNLTHPLLKTTQTMSHHTLQVLRWAWLQVLLQWL